MQPGGGAAITAVIKGGVVQEVRQRFADWLTQTVRLGVGWRHAEPNPSPSPSPSPNPNPTPAPNQARAAPCLRTWA